MSFPVSQMEDYEKLMSDNKIKIIEYALRKVLNLYNLKGVMYEKIKEISYRNSFSYFI